jgi:hypothetical protein
MYLCRRHRLTICVTCVKPTARNLSPLRNMPPPVRYEVAAIECPDTACIPEVDDSADDADHAGGVETELEGFDEIKNLITAKGAAPADRDAKHLLLDGDGGGDGDDGDEGDDGDDGDEGDDSDDGDDGDQRSAWLRMPAALALHYMCTGFVSTVYAAFLRLLLVGVVTSTDGLNFQYSIMAPWGVACVFAFASDNFPLGGFHRKYYCLAGHAVCATATAMVGVYRGSVEFDCFRSKVGCGADTTEGATQIVGLLVVATIGVVVADTAANGHMVKVTRLHDGRPATTVGEAALTISFDSMPIACLLLRLFGTLVAATVVWLSATSDVAGSTTTVATTRVFWAATAVSIVGAACWLPPCLLHPRCAWWDLEKTQPHNVAHRCRHARDFVYRVAMRFKNKPFASFMMFNVLCPACMSVKSPAATMLLSDHATVPLALPTATVYLVVILACRRWQPRHGVPARDVVVAATTTTALATLIIEVLAIHDVVAGGILQVMHAVVSGAAASTAYLVASLVAVELAEGGDEASVYAIVATTQVLSVAVARVAAIAFYGQLPVWLGFHEWGALSNHENYEHLDEAFRAVATISVLASAAFVLGSQMFVGLIPQDAIDFDHGPNTMVGVAVVIILALLFSTGWTINCLTLMPASKCSVWLGGVGCGN